MWRMRHTNNPESLEGRVRLRQVWGSVAGHEGYGGISIANFDRGSRSLLFLGRQRLNEEAVHSSGYEDLAREGGHRAVALPWAGRETVITWQTDRRKLGKLNYEIWKTTIYVGESECV